MFVSYNMVCQTACYNCIHTYFQFMVYFECSFNSFAKICSLMSSASLDSSLRTAEQTNPVTVNDTVINHSIHHLTENTLYYFLVYLMHILSFIMCSIWFGVCEPAHHSSLKYDNYVLLFVVKSEISLSPILFDFANAQQI